MSAMQAPRLGFGQAQIQQSQNDNNLQSLSGFLTSPVDLPSLVNNKGYNPQHFDVRPPFVGDVHLEIQPLNDNLVIGAIFCYQILHRR